MKHLAISTNNVARTLVVIVLVGVPFHAFLTVWGSAIFGHYQLLRLWDDGLLALLVGVAAYWLAKDRVARTWFMESLLVRLIVAYGLLTVLLGVVSLARGDVSPKALLYGLLVNARYLVWFLAVLLTAQRSNWLQRHWRQLVLLPAGIVVVFALLQYFALPHNFLEHFGYHTTTTIAPIETINHNSNYIRVQSTLRGANPLGAYLVVVCSAIVAAFLWERSRRSAATAVLLLTGVALYTTGSRSAWIGVVLSIATAAWLHLQGRRARKLLLYGAAVLLLVGIGAFLTLKDNAGLQNELLHTQDHSAVATSSNQAHASATLTGVKQVLHQPLGDGPGTAGPASVYNTKQPARIAENYYVQIAQETGWLGLALFLGIVTLVGWELYQRSMEGPLQLTVFAAFVGIAFVNLLSHAWSDDTLAFVWWGLAGIVLGSAKPSKAAK